MPRASSRKIIIAHIPVLHRGYLQFFKANPKHKTLYVVGQDILKGFDYLRKDLRALTPAEVLGILRATGWFDEVKLLTKKDLSGLDSADSDIILPDDDISEQLHARLPKAKTTLFPVFLRWDRRSVEDVDRVDPDVQVSKKQLDKQFMAQAQKASLKSSDIWRRVGAVLRTADGQTVFAKSNQGEPSPHSPWIEGDPRNTFNRGVGIEMSVFSHAEAAIIAEAARRGIALEGAKLYATTFPCPACAKLIAHSGVAEYYYQEGYALLDGKRVMQDYGVKIFQVKAGGQDTTHSATWVPYKKS